MTLVLDTNVVFDLESQSRETVSKLEELARQHPGRPYITSLTYFEAYYGALDKGARGRQIMLEHLDSFGLLNTTRGSAIKLAELRKSQREKGREAQLADLLIASIVIDRGMTLVTRDRHFEGIEGLKVVVV